MGPNSSSAIFSVGWYPEELSGCFWSSPQSQVELKYTDGANCLLLAGVLPHAAKGGKNALIVECNGHRMGEISNRSNLFRYFTKCFDLKRFSCDSLQLKLSVHHAYGPSQAEGSEDDRTLGFALTDLSLQCLSLPARCLQGWEQCLRYSLLLGFGSLRTVLEYIVQLWPSLWFGDRHSGRYSKSRLPLGLSVFILAESNIETLDACLQSVKTALENVREPTEVFIVSGRARRKRVRVLSESSGLHSQLLLSRGTGNRNSLIRKVLTKSRYGWVYYLDASDRLEHHALQQLLQWRAPNVFSMASRRIQDQSLSDVSESGWTELVASQGSVKIVHRQPEDCRAVRGNLFGMRTGSLFRKEFLQTVGDRGGMPSHYPADLEWGIRAWKMGWESLFIPGSIFYSSSSGALFNAPPRRTGLSQQDTWLLLIRNPFCGINRSQMLADLIYGTNWVSVPALLHPIILYELSRLRERPAPYPFHRFPFRYVNNKYYWEPRTESTKPEVIVVSPFVVFPPAHGGAVRMLHLMKALGREYRVHLISDEGGSYSAKSAEDYGFLASLHLVGGRVETPGWRESRIDRIQTHSHAILREHVSMLAAAYQPRAIQIEYVELAGLVQSRHHGAVWLLDLHDVLLADENDEFSDLDRYEWNLIRQFDGVLTCSIEDARLLPRENVFVVPNGANAVGRPYVPSGISRRLLFVGPFRSLQNIQGISIFLERVYPMLREDLEGLELWIVAGRGGPELVKNNPLFALPGIVLLDYVEDLRSLMDQCALTINPLYGVRGSCLKVIESVCAGRVCLSTREGARGFVGSGLKPLIVVERIEDLDIPIRQLLLDPAKRMRLEHCSFGELEQFTWEHSEGRIAEVYRSALAERAYGGDSTAGG